MKTALTVGCGSINGSVIIDTLVGQGYQVINIGSSLHPAAQNIAVVWKDLGIAELHKLLKFDSQFDFVFFNHNASSLNQMDFEFDKLDTLDSWKLVKNWQHSYWLSCQLPFLLLHTIRKNLTKSTKIGFMLSGTMMWDRQDSIQYPDYSSQKYFNYLAMQCLSKHYQTFGIMPNFNQKDSQNKLKSVIINVCSNDMKNNIFQV